MSEIKNSRLDLYGPEHSKCNHMMTLGFKGLTMLANDHKSGLCTLIRNGNMYVCVCQKPYDLSDFARKVTYCMLMVIWGEING